MTIVNIRRASRDDAFGMMQVHLSCLNESYVGFYSEVLLQKWKSLLDLECYAVKTESTGWCYVAVIENEFGEEVVGYGWLNTNKHQRVPKEYECDIQIESLYVSAHHQKCGIGQKLLQTIEAKAIEQKFTRIGILSSTFAVSFYEKIGYAVVKEPVWFDICKNSYSKGPYSCETKIMSKDLYATNKS